MLMISTLVTPVGLRIGREASARMVKAAGFDAVDFGISDYVPGSYSTRGEGDTVFRKSDEEVVAFFKDYARILREAGLEVGQTHAPAPNHSAGGDHPVHSERNIRIAALSVRITGEMGCGYCVVHPVCPRDCDYNHLPEIRKLYHDINMDFYFSLIPSARKYGVKVCLENMWGGFGGHISPTALSHPAEMAEWIDELNETAGEELFCACYDTGHAYLVGDDPAEGIRLLGKRLQRLHMHDTRKDDDAHTLPFEGKCDWSGIASALKEIGYSGTLNFETRGFQSPMPEPLLASATNMLGAAANYIRSLAE